MSELGDPDEPEDKRRFFRGEFSSNSGNNIELNADDEDGGILQHRFGVGIRCSRGWSAENRDRGFRERLGDEGCRGLRHGGQLGPRR